VAAEPLKIAADVIASNLAAKMGEPTGTESAMTAGSERAAE
jgi:hypothetical protein